ncbi:D-aminoacyl-tRNA deacylase [Spirochaetia bacterium]|nr:D-aminoacyl-tRNA deacylase [Spirochaetia bacterium]
MKAVVQRVMNAGVSVDGVIHGKIDSGLLVYLGVAQGDAKTDADWLAEKIANLRIFKDGDGRMNCSVKDTGGGVLAVSQFTLLAEARKGRRPYYGNAADPDTAKDLYNYFMDKIREQGLVCESGVFQAHMQVSYTNDGPVTIILDTKEI